jgi:cytidylate kinase
LGGRGRQISEFEASLVCRVSSRTARVTQRNHVSKQQQQKQQKQNKKKEKEKFPKFCQKLGKDRSVYHLILLTQTLGHDFQLLSL